MVFLDGTGVGLLDGTGIGLLDGTAKSLTVGIYSRSSDIADAQSNIVAYGCRQ